jgi:hypothetical protein
MEKIHIIMYCGYTFILLLLIISAILSMFEVWPFNFYKRTYAPPGISTGANQSPYSLN